MYVIRERMFRMGEDSDISDEAGQPVLHVDGKVMSLHNRLVLSDPAGREAGQVHRRLAALRPTYEITIDGKDAMRTDIKAGNTFPDHQPGSRRAARARDEGQAMGRPHAQAWLSEFAGTTILLFAVAVTARWLAGPHSALASAVPGLAGRLAITGVVIGTVVGLLIVSPFGRSSGGHFNPAVSVTLWLLRGLPGRDAAAYVAAQLAGSLAGVMLGRAVLGAVLTAPAVDYAAIQPAAGWSSGAVFAGEAVSLAVLMAAVVAFLDRPALMRWTPAVVAAGVAVLILAGGLTSGGSFNPARQLGPLLFAGRLSYLWAYMLGPLAGAVLLGAGVRALGLPQPLTCDLCGTRSHGAVQEPVMQPAEDVGHRSETSCT